MGWEDVEAPQQQQAQAQAEPQHWRERAAARQRYWSLSHGFQMGRKLATWGEADAEGQDGAAVAAAEAATQAAEAAGAAGIAGIAGSDSARKRVLTGALCLLACLPAAPWACFSSCPIGGAACACHLRCQVASSCANPALACQRPTPLCCWPAPLLAPPSAARDHSPSKRSPLPMPEDEDGQLQVGVLGDCFTPKQYADSQALLWSMGEGAELLLQRKPAFRDREAAACLLTHTAQRRSLRFVCVICRRPYGAA